jgi:bifunctional non-homologous end joining protein LigD
MALKDYHKKRRFNVTSEPRGSESARKKAGSDSKLQFVIQKHDASHLHYDFRLEMGGVLKSWAVPKGPSLDPSVKSLAVEVEDHPIEYAKFEGTIPKGEYGGGTVMLWDRGRWSPSEDKTPEEMYRDGKFRFTLHGEKLNGAWTLVRMNRGGVSKGPRSQWLLKKSDDDAARPTREFEVREEENTSVSTGRSMEEIAGDQKSKVWRSNRGSENGHAPKLTAPGKVAKKSAKKAKPAASEKLVSKEMTKRSSAKPRPVKLDPSKLPGAVKSPMPREVEPQLATLVDEAPSGEQWIHEVKFDGYRLLAYLDKGEVHLITRGLKDWTGDFPIIRDELAKLGVQSAILDGEAVALNEAGISNFQTLQSTLKAGTNALAYFVFDVLYVNGYDLRKCALADRRHVLQEMLGHTAGDTSSPLRFSEAITGQGRDVFTHACKLAMEGVISKRLDSPYVSDRTKAWVKSKCIARQEMVIGGYTDPRRSRTGFGALLIGYYQDGALTYAGKCGTGFDIPMLQDLHKRLERMEQRKCPFTPEPRGYQVRDAHWVKPVMVAEIEFTEWTNDGRLRHPAFVALREDKPAIEVVREKAVHSTSRADRNGRHEPLEEDTAPFEPNQGSDNGMAKKAPAPRRITRAAPAEDPTVLGVTISHPDRLLYKGEGVRKLDMALYYEAIADRMLEQIAGYPLVLVRCPQGTGAACFYQKNWSEEPLKGTHLVSIKESTGDNKYVVIDKPVGLIGLVQRGVLEFHMWGSKENNIECPDHVVFDFDPGPGVEWSAVVQGALDCRRRLKKLGLESFVKFSGGKGLHVVMPMRATVDFDEAKDWAHVIAQQMELDDPDRYVSNMSKAKRKGKIFVDYLRNGRGATAVAPYSTRSRPGAPVSLPMTWKEVEGLTEPPHFNVVDAVKRLRTDPWKDYRKVQRSQKLPTSEVKAKPPRAPAKPRRSKQAV